MLAMPGFLTTAVEPRRRPGRVNRKAQGWIWVFG
jgi:hypothetical protein